MGGEETDVQFNCTIHRVHAADNATLWYGEQPKIGKWLKLFSNDLPSEEGNKYRIEGTHNLVIRNVETSDAKAYSCQNRFEDEDENLAKVVAQLIVLGE